MKMRIISSKDEINGLEEGEELVHLAFRPSNTDLLDIITKCKVLKAIHIPPSYKKTISKTARLLLQMQNVTLLEGDVWGHRKDINEYSVVSDTIYGRIKQYREEGLSDEAIAEKMAGETGIEKDFVYFLLKQNT